MRRRVFNLAAMVSLALFIATVALWVRGRITWKYDLVGLHLRVREDGGQTSFRATNTPFGIDLDRVRSNTVSFATPGWEYRSSHSTATDAETVAETYKSLGGHVIADA